MNRTDMNRTDWNRQRGAALFISLMFLIILTVIGLSAANVSVLQERMAGNVRETNEAFQTAEATLRGIEQRVELISAGATGGLDVIPIWSEAQVALGVGRGDCTLSGIDPSTWPWSGSPDVPGGEFVVIELSGATGTGAVFGSACRPMQGEDAGNPGQVAVYYLIAARAFGPSGRNETIVQSIYFFP